MKTRRVLSLSILAIVGISISGCGKIDLKKVVEDIAVKTYDVSGEAFSEVEFDLRTGAIQLPEFELPLVDPKQPEKNYGSVSIRSTEKNESKLTVSVDMAQISGAFSMGSDLPNGSQLPVIGINENQVISVSIGKTKSRGYFPFYEGVALIGAAIVVKELNSLGALMGDIAIFPALTFPNGIRGTVGLFTGREISQSGVAVFVDVGEALQKLSGGEIALAQSAAKKSKIRFVNFKAQTPDQEHTIGLELYKLHTRSAKLNLR